ncbi:hypothetical protein LUZ61_020117 [Rhynchospora tenuis]|uniref:Uncharacterized protein n=1 Tax=Rhynchospora tenuis TaxID=198213 RepID=A0AAD5ZCJ2_9POAL|nr:hypothetical protein LUZ61_020117 [Rhynchospora tenuis]
MKMEYLDFVLVPLGLAALLIYHLWLLHKILHHPDTTVIGNNARNYIVWVETIMQDPVKNGILAVQTLRNNIMASTLLASMTIMLASATAVLMASSNSSGDNLDKQNRPLRGENIVIGNKSEVALSIKFFAILVCFLLSFIFNVQSVRYYSNAGCLLAIPPSKSHHQPGSSYATGCVIKGSYFSALGFHSVYFSIPLFVWIFGPIPMFMCSLLLIFLLYFLDTFRGNDGNKEAIHGSVKKVGMSSDQDQQV